MIIELMPHEGENTIIKLTYETEDMFEGEETISVAGINIQATADTAEEKAVIRKEERLAIKAAVANHLKIKIAAIPKEPSTVIENMVGLTIQVDNIEWFTANFAEEE